MRSALLLALAPLAFAPALAQVSTTTEPPTPPVAGQPAPGEAPEPMAPPEAPPPPEAPMPSENPMPEVPPPTPAPPTTPPPVEIVPDAPMGAMATPRNSGSNTAVSGGTTSTELKTQVPSTKDYPTCSKTVTDNCVNRGKK